MSIRGWRLIVVAMVAAATGALGAAGPVGADTPISSAGTVGNHHLNDTSGHPGVKCLYQDGAGGGDEDIYLLKVGPPVIYAANTKPTREKQLVGWRALIQRRVHGSTAFVTVQQGGIHTAWAWDDTPAVLYTREYSVTPLYGADFRVRIKMFWFAPSGSGAVTGTAINEVDWYKKIYLSTDFGDDIATLHQYCADYYPG